MNTPRKFTREYAEKLAKKRRAMKDLKITPELKAQLKLEVDHIFQSGANEVRVLEMTLMFAARVSKEANKELLEGLRMFTENWHTADQFKEALDNALDLIKKHS